MREREEQTDSRADLGSQIDAGARHSGEVVLVLGTGRQKELVPLLGELQRCTGR